MGACPGPGPGIIGADRSRVQKSTTPGTDLIRAGIDTVPPWMHGSIPPGNSRVVRHIRGWQCRGTCTLLPLSGSSGSCARAASAELSDGWAAADAISPSPNPANGLPADTPSRVSQRVEFRWSRSGTVIESRAWLTGSVKSTANPKRLRPAALPGPGTVKP